MLKPRSGTWHVDFRLPSGKRVRGSTGVPLTGSKKDAWDRHQALEREALAKESRSGAGVLSLREAFKAAMLRHSKWRQSTSLRTIQDNFEHVAKHFGEHRGLPTISTEDVVQYRLSLVKEGKAPSTINQRLSLLSVLFTVAQDMGVKVEKPRFKRELVKPGRFRILSREEEQTVLKWFINSPKQGMLMAGLVECLLDTGFRLSEMLGISRLDVDWHERMVTAGRTKNGDPRTVPMTTRVANILQRRLQEAPVAFSGLSVDRADDLWDSMRKSIGLSHDKQFVIHALRHTCCSRLVAAGMDAFRVQRWMGHRSIKTTQLYVTLTAPDLRDLACALEGSFGHTGQPSSPAGEPIVPGRDSTVNPQVPGSSPGRGATKNNNLEQNSNPPADDVSADVTKNPGVFPHLSRDAPDTTP